MEPRRRSSTIMKVLLSMFLIFGLLVTCVVGILVYQYSQDPNLFKNLTDNFKQQANQNQQGAKTDFSSNTVFEPKGTTVDLVRKVSPSVTTVVVKIQQQASPFSADTETQQGIGTGFFVSEDGLLVTNEHVVCDSINPSNVTIVTSENKTYSVQSIASDPFQDIAILKVDTKGDKISPLKFANSSSTLEPGQDVIAVGNPLGVNPGSVTRGIISGLGRNVSAQGNCQNKAVEKDYEGVIQTDAAINQGNSGGPLINLNGEVVGVNSATSTDANNISYAVPFQRVVRLLERYQNKNGKLTLPFLGVSYRMIDTNLATARGVPEGAFVMQVVAGGPADKVSIKRGDIITKLGDHKIDFSLQATLNQYFEPGQTVKAEVYRPNTTSLFGDEVSVDGKTFTVDIVIGER
jgi:S1-C subfamily serine protease